MFDPYAPKENSVQVFQCPHCGEFINTSMTACKFCNAPVDMQAAQQLAALQGQVNWAVNEASLAFWLAKLLPVAFVASFIPLYGGIAYRMFSFGLLGLLVAILHWQFAYAKLPTKDADFPLAEKRILRSTLIWGALFVGWILLLIVKLVRGGSIWNDLFFQ